MQVGDHIWVHEQPGPYYRRHLLIHEGTHALVNRLFGHVGPVWYREGIAEYLGTHQHAENGLKLGFFPVTREQVEHWGRIKLVREATLAGNARSIPSIVNASVRDFSDVHLYAWSWALATFLQHHFPADFEATHKSMMLGSDDVVSSTFLSRYRRRKSEFDLAWELFLHHLDYGYQPAAEVIHFKADRLITPNRAVVVEVDAAKGWQSTGLTVPSGVELQVNAMGRYAVGLEPKVWWCEPQGVTIEYYQQRPLGMLLAAVVDLKNDGLGLARPVPVGRTAKWHTDNGGVLFFRVNERADRLSDNRGTLTVTVQASKGSPAAPAGL